MNTITNDQIKEAYERPELLKELFPDAFKPVLEVGKWYCIDDVYSLFCITSIKNNTVYGYGFNRGQYFDYINEKGAFCACNSVSIKRARLATPEEVEKALINEAVKKGYCDAKNINGFAYPLNKSYFYDSNSDRLYKGSFKGLNVTIFYNGKWAEIIQETEIELTLDQIAKKFGVDKVKIKP